MKIELLVFVRWIKVKSGSNANNRGYAVFSNIVSFGSILWQKNVILFRNFPKEINLSTVNFFTQTVKDKIWKNHLSFYMHSFY